jgi:ferric-dicitrate binding protein FerR (iron transport regulator)
MDPNQKEVWAIKYLCGEATLKELEALKVLLNEDLVFRKRFIELRDIWNAAHLTEFDSQNAFCRFEKRIESSSEERHKVHSITWLKYVAVAASLIISILAGRLFISAPETDLIYYTHQTAAGERKTIELPDGTKVWLNGQSILTYTSSFNAENRSVDFNGEAFFDVSHDHTKPFEVLSDNHHVKVLGTRFKLEARSEDIYVTTVLVEGKVQVTVPERQLGCILLPGQKSVYNKVNRQLEKERETGIEEYTALVKGQLVFDDERLSVLVHRLEYWYGVTIVVDEAIKDLRFTGTFEKESIEDVLNILSMSNGIKYTRTNGTIDITLN